MHSVITSRDPGIRTVVSLLRAMESPPIVRLLVVQSIHVPLLWPGVLDILEPFHS